MYLNFCRKSSARGTTSGTPSTQSKALVTRAGCRQCRGARGARTRASLSTGPGAAAAAPSGAPTSTATTSSVWSCCQTGPGPPSSGPCES